MTTPSASCVASRWLASEVVPVFSSLAYLSRTLHRGVSPECDAVQDLVERLKSGDRAAADEVAADLARHPALRGFAGVVVPAPRSTSSRPTLLHLAAALARRGVGSRVEAAVERVVPVESSRIRRRRGEPGLTDDEHAATMGVRGSVGRDEPVLVVDDVYTTGATIRAVAKVLRAAGHLAPIIAATAAHVTGPDAACGVDHARVAARYKSKKKVPKADGKGTTTVYEYSERQVQHRNREKAKRVEALEGRISDLRKQVRKDLESKDDKVRLVALAVGLLDETFERVGNDRSADEGHFGVTGWLRKHVTFGKGTATIKYVGKSGVEHEKVVDDKALVQALRGCCDDKGKDEAILSAGDARVTARDVNEYLEPFDVTAKDVRGFHANKTMRDRLKAVRSEGGALPKDKKERADTLKREFKEALEATAEAVGHEAATLRTQYLIPGLEASFMKDGTVEKVASASRVADRHLAAADAVPRVTRRKDEAVSLVASLSEAEREVVGHLERGGSAMSTGGDLSLGVPKTSPRVIPGGASVVVSLARAGWVRKADTPAAGSHWWWLTAGAERVLSLASARVATKSEGEREEEEDERLVRQSPKERPPRDDRRRERVHTKDDDAGEARDKDTSKNYKDLGG